MRYAPPPPDNRSVTDDLVVCVAIVTYRRANALREVLGALLTIERPANCSLHILIVDNDPNRSAEAVVKGFSQNATWPTDYLVEPRRGIPFARNRCLAEAVGVNADALVFIDDDELPSPQWLARLVGHYRTTGCQLIGGPVAMQAEPNGALSLWQRAVFASIVAWVNRKARRSKRKADRGSPITVVTNNWLCDFRFISDKKLRFRTDHAASGGSDAVFFREAVAKGVRHGWCPDAVVYDRLPVQRVSLAYQFRRARAQSTNNFHMRHPATDAPQRSRTIAIAILRITLGALGIVLPIYGAASLVMGVRSIGWGFGRFDGLAGRRSDFYSRGD
jgi:glycosyltransferase involved in cell wall biosynthesis